MYRVLLIIIIVQKVQHEQTNKNKWQYYPGK